MLLRAAVPRERMSLPKNQSGSSPAHTSRGMRIQLLDMMSRSRNSRKLLDTMSRSRRISRNRKVFLMAVIVFRAAQGKQKGRKQSRSRKNADSRGSSKKKTALRGIRKSRTVTMRAVKRRIIFLKNKMLLRRRAEGSRPRKQILRTITAARIPTTRAKKRADTAGGSARTENG